MRPGGCRRLSGPALCALALLAATAPGVALASPAEPLPPVDLAYSATASRSEGPGLPGLRVLSAPIDEVMVYARSRRRMQDPEFSSLIRLTGRELRSRGIRTTRDLDRLMANLLIDRSTNTRGSLISVRGLGNLDPEIEEQDVGTLVNGVLLSPLEFALIPIDDIERIDIRSGSQVSGVPVLGGTIDLIPRKPDFDFSGSANLRFGNFDQLGTRLSLDLPLVPERVSARLSASTSQRRGFAKNRFVGGGSTAGDDRLVSGSADLAWNAREDLELQLNNSFNYAPRLPVGRKCKFLPFAELTDPNAVPTGDAARLGALSNSVLRTPTSMGELQAALDLSKDGARTGGEFGKACRREDERDNRKVALDSKLRDLERTFRSTLIATYTPSERISLKSTTSLARSDSNASVDNDATGLPLRGDFRGSSRETHERGLSEDLSMSGTEFEGRLTWMLGFSGRFGQVNGDSRLTDLPGSVQREFFIRAAGTNAEKNLRIDEMLKQVTDPAQRAAIEAMRLPVDGFALENGFGECIRVDGTTEESIAKTCLRSFRTPLRTTRSRRRDSSYAFFFDSRFKLTPALSFEAGLRYMNEQRRSSRLVRIDNIEAFAQRTDRARQPFGIDGDPRNGGRFFAKETLDAGGVTFDESEGRFGSFRPRIGMRYEFNPQLSTFASMTRSLRGGPGDDDPEKITEYEVGLRSDWLSSRLSVNLTGFTNVLTRIDRVSGGSGLVRGGELDVKVTPLPQLQLTSQVGMTHARYTRVFNRSLKNNPFPNTPTYTMNFSGTYSLPLGSLGDLQTRFDWRHEGQRSTDTADTPELRLSKQGTLSGRISLDLPGESTSISLFGSNLLDRETMSGVREAPGSLQSQFIAPRTYGIELNWNF